MRKVIVPQQRLFENKLERIKILTKLIRTREIFFFIFP